MSRIFPTQPSCVLFDLDGTLIDTAADFALVVDELTAKAGIARVPYAAVHQTVSNGARALVQLAFGIDAEHPRFQERLADLLSLYSQRIEQTRSSLYPGMEALLSDMEARAIQWGVVTNKPALYARPLLAKLDLLERCASLVCPDDVTHTKPHPEPLLLACQQLGLAAERAIYVGDHPRDIEAGKAAGMYTIAVTYGYLPATPHVEQWGADLIVDDVEQIRKRLAS